MSIFLLLFVVVRTARVLDHCGQWPKAIRIHTHAHTLHTHTHNIHRCASAHTKVAYRPADSRESLPTRHCIVEQNYTYIVSHVNERSALTLLSSLRIVLRSRHGPPARPLYPRCDLRISYPETPTFFLLFFSR